MTNDDFSLIDLHLIIRDFGCRIVAAHLTIGLVWLETLPLTGILR